MEGFEPSLCPLQGDRFRPGLSYIGTVHPILYFHFYLNIMVYWLESDGEGLHLTATSLRLEAFAALHTVARRVTRSTNRIQLGSSEWAHPDLNRGITGL